VAKMRKANKKRAVRKISAPQAGAPSSEADGPPPNGDAPPSVPLEILRLVRVAQENPFRFFSLAEVAKICGFGSDVLTALNSLGAPVVARRCNPRLLVEWIGRNADKIGKVRG
jgi:hypothetical protein